MSANTMKESKHTSDKAKKDKPRKIIGMAEAYVHHYLLDNLPSEYLFHNIEHAREVAEVCGFLAEAAGLSKEDSEIVQLAAWFHDCGYAEGNLLQGGEVAAAFLDSKGYPSHKIERVKALINHHHSKETPESDLEKILHDANWSYLGRKRFFRRSKLLRLEKEKVKGNLVDTDDWNRELLDTLLQHKYHTPWAEVRFSKRRNKNIARQRKNIKRAVKDVTRKRTGKEFGRGVDTLYRVTMRSHINLSSIADGKANMIISINTLVLSILITAGSAGYSLTNLNLKENIVFIIPILTLMLTSLTAIIFAVLSASPKISTEKLDEESVRAHKHSLLFFGNFLKLTRDRFVDHLRELKKDQELLYDDLSKDLYNLGAVLQKKYKLITIAYRVFVGGLVLSFIVFVVLLLAT
jgi:HD superfamily phosphodiesterase